MTGIQFYLAAVLCMTVYTTSGSNLKYIEETVRSLGEQLRVQQLGHELLVRSRGNSGIVRTRDMLTVSFVTWLCHVTKYVGISRTRHRFPLVMSLLLYHVCVGIAVPFYGFESRGQIPKIMTLSFYINNFIWKTI